MKFTILVPNSLRVRAVTQPWQAKLGPVEIARVVALAEEVGYHKATLGEHVLMPEAHLDASGPQWPDVTTTLAFVAAQAPSLRVGSGVSVLPLQHPIVQAKRWATLDWLSGGRADLHIGVGWLKDEFDVLGVDFTQRGRIADEYIEAIITLWTEETPSFSGRFVSFPPLAAEPKPVQKPHIPLWFGGSSDAMMRRVAKWGAGWTPFLVAPEEFPARMDRIRSRPEYDGRTIELHLGLGSLKLASESHRASGAGGQYETWNAQELIDLLSRLSALGVTQVTMSTPPLRDLEHYLDRLRWEGSEVFPHVE